MTLLTHITDFRAFPHPSKLMSYIGLVSKENSSGDKVSKSGITKQGNSILRKALIIASQQYNKAERTGKHLIGKRKDLSLTMTALVQKADRICSKFSADTV
jgi:transposase